VVGAESGVGGGEQAAAVSSGVDVLAGWGGRVGSGWRRQDALPPGFFVTM
jgi:hypothetical protein